MKRQKTIEKINKILGVDDYRGVPRGTIAPITEDTDITYLLRHNIVALAGDRYVYAY